MPPTAKDLELATSNAQSVAASGAGKAQPVALEVPVSVNGARTVEGSDKREPFSESTQTVLVFASGAVIRLASSVTPGQLLFLTNDKTKKEVVCQVLKSKNYSNVSGYVELEFTEAVPGFWGVRFGNEGAPKPANVPAPVTSKVPVPQAQVPSVVKPKIPAPAVSSLPKQAPPAAPVNISASTIAPKTEIKPAVSAPRAGDVASTTALPKAPIPSTAPTPPVSAGSTSPVSSRPTETKPSAPTLVASKTPTAPPAATNTHTPVSPDPLKRGSARLEELSSMTWNTQVPGNMPGSVSKANDSGTSSKVIEIAKPHSPGRVAPTASGSSSGAGLDSDQVKIPSWLEPLARNAATPAQNELAAREEAEQVDEFEVQDVSGPATTHESAVVTVPEQALDAPSSSETAGRERHPAKGSNKMILIAAAAAGFLILAAGGTWYARQSSTSSNGPENKVASAVPSALSASSAAVQTKTAVQPAAKPAADVPAPSGGSFSTAAANSSPVSSAPNISQPAPPSAQPLKGASDKTATAELSAYKRLAEPQPQPAAVQPAKRPSIGSVTLAAPAARRTTSAAPGEADLAPSFGGAQVTSTGDAMGGGLGGGGTRPEAPPAPLPVGGDVRQARLLSSSPPLYPTLAKAQHVEGAVRVDALVDENGRVSSAKVVGGPTLLHQAAIDAVRQWKYQPATLDGKPVPMHLTVTLQFKLQ
jgi:periplasmic protein TonB